MRHDRTLRRLERAAVVQPNSLGDRESNILLIDEQHLTRDCICSELGRRLPEFKIIACAGSSELIERAPELARLDLIILHVHPDRTNRQARNGDLAQNQIAAQLAQIEHIAPATPRILLSEVDVPEEIVEAFHCRIRGYVPTTLPIKQVAEAIRFVAAGGTFVPPCILSMHWEISVPLVEPKSVALTAAPSDFSPRQNEVLRMLWNGSSNKVIAYELHMSESTVKVHIRHIMKKLNVNNRTQVVLRTCPQQLADRRVSIQRPNVPVLLRGNNGIASAVASDAPLHTSLKQLEDAVVVNGT